MNPYDVFLGLLGLACTSVCLVPFIGTMLYVARWHALSIADDMQSRLQSWAAEQGYRIVGQERPTEPPLWRWIGLTGPLPLPRSCLWVFDTRRRGPLKTFLSLSTRVTVLDSQGRARRGLMAFVRTNPYPGSRFEPMWEDAPDLPPPIQPTAAEPQVDPLWDPWVDLPGESADDSRREGY